MMGLPSATSSSHDDPPRRSRQIMLLLAAGTTVFGAYSFVALAGVLDYDDIEEEAKDEMIHALVVGFRVWFLASAVTGVVGAKGALMNHLPSLRLFAIHSIIDAALAGLVTFTIGLVAFNPSVSGKLGHAVCEHLSRGDSLGIVYSPGSGLEACEEKWSYGLAPVLLLLAAVALYLRSKATAFIYSYYRTRAASVGQISLESPSLGPVMSNNTNVNALAHNAFPMSSHPMKAIPSTASSSSSSSSSASSAPSSSSSSQRRGRHSRSSSASTVRPGTASRIVLLPADYKAASPALRITPPTPSTTSSTDSLETITGIIPTADSSSSTARRRAMSMSMSHGAGSGSGAQSLGKSVVVYAPVLMSIEEAHRLGGREAVIASGIVGTSSSSGTRASSVSSTTTATATSPTSVQAPRLRQHSPPLATAKRMSPALGEPIMEEAPAPSAVSAKNPGPFASIKGYRDATEMVDLALVHDKML